MTVQDDQNRQPQSATSELIESVRELISMMSRGGISELDLTAGDVSIRLRGQTETVTASATTVFAGSVGSVPALPLQADEGSVITSPMIGTFYTAPAPGEAPFVQVGDEVELGQVIGIIEAMKIMNEITADHSGVVVEVMVQNAQPVEYGSPLMRVASADDLE